jgi:hypothetical protein
MLLLLLLVLLLLLLVLSFQNVDNLYVDLCSYSMIFRLAACISVYVLCSWSLLAFA